MHALFVGPTLRGINELNSGDMKIGTTKRGIGPTYASKMERYGVRMGSLRNWEHFKEQYMRIYNIVEHRADCDA